MIQGWNPAPACTDSSSRSRSSPATRYDDPEWAADAAWGALTNMYGLLTNYTGIEELAPEDGIG